MMKRIEDKRKLAGLIEEKSLMDGRMPTTEEVKRLLDFLGLAFDPVTKKYYPVSDLITGAHLAQ